VPGQPLIIDLSAAPPVAAVRLNYRHVNQAERFNTVTMERREDRFHATIPAAYAESFYPLEYYFELKNTNGTAQLYPGFSSELTNQPYFVVRRA